MDLHVRAHASRVIAVMLAALLGVTMAGSTFVATAAAQSNQPDTKADRPAGIRQGSADAQPGAVAQVPDGAAVTVTNSFQAPGEPEEIFAGPETVQVGEGIEFEGFGGFDIDVSTDMIVMDWSTDEQFDDFEGPFEGGFRDIFIFELPGLDFVAEVDEATNLIPEVTQLGTTVRVVFTDGMVYGDGQRAIIELIDNSAPAIETPTPTPTPEPTPTPTPESDEGDGGTGDGGDDGDGDGGTSDGGDSGGDDDSGSDDGGGDSGTGDTLPETGTASTIGTTIALGLLMSGAVLTVGARRHVD